MVLFSYIASVFNVLVPIHFPIRWNRKECIYLERSQKCTQIARFRHFQLTLNLALWCAWIFGPMLLRSCWNAPKDISESENSTSEDLFALHVSVGAARSAIEWYFYSRLYIAYPTARLLRYTVLGSFLALLCATAQQSYCRRVGVRRRPSVVRRHYFFLGNRQVDWHQILLTDTYPPYLQTTFFVCWFFIFFFFGFITIFFCFPQHSTIWEKKFQTASPLRARIRFTPKKIRHTPWGGSVPKLSKELWNLKFWIFAIFFVCFH